MSSDQSEEETNLPGASCLPELLRRVGRTNPEGVNILVQDKILNVTMMENNQEWKQRKAAKGAVTRRKNLLLSKIAGGMVDEVASHWNEFLEAFGKLENAHDAYIATKNSEEDDPADATFMDGPMAHHKEAQQAWKIWYEAQEEKREARQVAVEAERQAKLKAEQDIKEAAEKE